MRQITCAVLVLSVTFAAGGAGPASKPASKAATQRDLPLNELLQQIVESDSPTLTKIAETLKIEGGQAGRIAAHQTRRDARLAELKVARREESAAMEKAMEGIVEQTLGQSDTQRWAVVLDRLANHKTLVREIAAIHHAYVHDLMNELTPEQRIRWYTLRVRDQVDDEFVEVDLSAEQQRAVDGICQTAATEIIAFGDERTRDQVGEVYSKARKLCRDKVLALRKREEPTWGSDKPLLPEKQP